MRRFISSGCLILLLAGCYQRDMEPREDYTLCGYVYDCTTNTPVAGAGIYVAARSVPSGSGMGFWGPTVAEGGKTTTDQNGYWEVLPYKYSFTDAYEITAQKDSVLFGTATLLITHILIFKSGDKITVDTICLNP